MTRIACGLLLVALAGSSAGQDKESPFDRKLLLGRWELAEPKKDEVAQVEFKDGSKLTFKLGAGGQTQTVEGTYTVAGAKLRITMKLGEKTVTEEVVVLTLTKDELHTEDAKGKQERLRRVK